MADFTVRFHWLALTFFLEFEDFKAVIYEGWIKETFGDLVASQHGGRGYREMYTAAAGVQVYSSPVNMERGFNVHLVFPGTACEAIVPDRIIELMRWLSGSGIRFNTTRIDLAVDNAEFTPLEFFQAIQDGKLTSLAKRDHLKYFDAPFEENEKGEIGNHGTYLGSRQSERMVRVYDKHGFTRLEMQTSGARACLIALEFLTAEYKDWFSVAMKHIRQYIELDCDFWRDFVSGSVRGNIKISSARVVAVNKMVAWLEKQVAAAVYVLETLSGEIYLRELSELGKQKIGAMRTKGSCRYDPLLQLVGA